MLGGAESFQQGGYARTPDWRFPYRFIWTAVRTRVPGSSPPPCAGARRAGFRRGHGCGTTGGRAGAAGGDAAVPGDQSSREVKPGASVIATAADASGARCRHWWCSVMDAAGRRR